MHVMCVYAEKVVFDGSMQMMQRRKRLCVNFEGVFKARNYTCDGCK